MRLIDITYQTCHATLLIRTYYDSRHVTKTKTQKLFFFTQNMCSQRHRALVRCSPDRGLDLVAALGHLHRNEPQSVGRHRRLEQTAQRKPGRP